MISSDKKTQKNPQKYECEFCLFSSSNKKDFNRHLATDKHKKQQNMIKSDKIMINSDEKTLKIPQIVNEKFVYILLKRT